MAARRFKKVHLQWCHGIGCQEKKLAHFVPKNRWAAAALDEIGISDPAAAANYTNTREDWSRLGAILRAPHQLF
jgi:hypothetical protein